MIKDINAYYISLFSLRSQNENCPTERTDVLKPYSQQGFKEKILKHPAEAAIGGVATVGAVALSAIKLFSKSGKNLSDDSSSQTGNQRNNGSSQTDDLNRD